jgi:hypothetical protein
MDRSEMVRRLVLSEISNDYENVDQIIFPDVRQECWNRGVKVERSDIVEALRSLIEDGFAKAYILSTTKPYATELSGMPGLEIVEEDFETHFFATKTGRNVQDDYVGFPFDDLE